MTNAIETLTPRQLFLRKERAEARGDLNAAGRGFLAGKAYREAMAGQLQKRIEKGGYEAWQLETLQAEYARLSSQTYDPHALR